MKELSKHNDKISHLKNLMVLAMADGHIALEEEHLLIAMAHQLGLNENIVQEIKSDFDNIEFKLPDLYEDRIEQLNDLLTLMTIDGSADSSEIDLFKKVAGRFELPESTISQLLKKYL